MIVYLAVVTAVTVPVSRSQTNYDEGQSYVEV